jgi:PIN domain
VWPLDCLGRVLYRAPTAPIEKAMPNLSRDDIKARIADRSIFAISIDTAIFDGLQGQFDNAVLRRLDQFHARDVRVIFSEIVAREIKRHVALAAKETQRDLNKALRRHVNRWKLHAPDDPGDPLAIEADADLLAEAQFERFLEAVKGEIVSATGNPDLPAEVLGRYFSEAPPFGESDKRKHEFPDAFALLSLEGLARGEGKLMLCVTPDKGWQTSASQSEHLICVNDLQDALSYFNDAYQALAEEIVAAWRQRRTDDFLEEVERAFELRLGDLDFHATGDAAADFEAEPIEAVLQYIAPDKIGSPTVIAVDADTITFTVSVEGLVSFSARFDFFIRDSVDKDEVPLNSEQATVEKVIPFDLTITADRRLDDEPVFYEVEVAHRPFDVDFGYVEVFPHENPEHEKY